MPESTDPKTDTEKIEDLLKKEVKYSKTQDDLLDIHIGNPLRRITQLLEQIKKQKAFSFTIKGSLGVLGIAVAVSAFGIFGGAKMFCDKGVQTQIGVVKILAVQEEEPTDIFLLGPLIDTYKHLFLPVNTNLLHDRVILVKNDKSTVYLPYSKGVYMKVFEGQDVIATGLYDSCSSTLKVENQTAIEPAL